QAEQEEEWAYVSEREVLRHVPLEARVVEELRGCEQREPEPERRAAPGRHAPRPPRVQRAHGRDRHECPHVCAVPVCRAFRTESSMPMSRGTARLSALACVLVLAGCGGGRQ